VPQRLRGPHMKRTTAIAVSLCLGLAGLAASFATAPTVSAQAPGAWKTLFNGKDLTNWTIPAGRGRAGAPPPAADAPPGWHIENGVIIGGEAKPGERSGSLATNDKYKDFEFELD